MQHREGLPESKKPRQPPSCLILEKAQLEHLLKDTEKQCVLGNMVLTRTALVPVTNTNL